MNVNAFNLIILIGVVHGMMMSGLLFFSAKNQRSGNILLALLLSFYTLPVLRVILHDLGFFSSFGFSFLSIELIYGLGPALYLYAKTVTDPKYVLNRKDLLHFLPVVLEILYYLSPIYRQHSFYFFGPVLNFNHLIWMLEQVGAIISILVYLGLTNKLLWKYSAWVKSNYSDTNRRTLSWLQKPVMLYTMFFVLWFSLRFIDVIHFNDSLPIKPYYPFLIFLSFSTYWIGTKGYLETQVDTAGFSSEKATRKSDPVDDALLISVYTKLEALMARDKLFLDADLSLPLLAEHLRINPRLLSNSINARAGVNFYDFVNRYRVEEFQRRMAADEAGQPLLNLAHDCGFGSKATFNHVFKKNTGMTPTQYKNKLLNEREKDGSRPE